MRVGIGSKNKAKISAVELALSMLNIEAEILAFDVDSNVSIQPFSDEETIEGALNRAKGVIESYGEAYNIDLAIGLEGGVDENQYGTFLCNWGAIVDREGRIGIGGGQRILLPEIMVKEMKQGYEMAEVIDRLVKRQDVRSNEGTIGVFTNNLITRSEMFRDVIICAYSRFLLSDYYK